MEIRIVPVFVMLTLLLHSSKNAFNLQPSMRQTDWSPI
jgi:hypothetical protein